MTKRMSLAESELLVQCHEYFSMKNGLLLLLGVGCLAGMQRMLSEDLVRENGAVAAQSLPLDRESSKIAYETATFGLG